MNYLFTSESVSSGHPDKIADQVSDAILDAYLENDPDSKVACECLITNCRLIIAGEAKSKAENIDHIAIAKRTIHDIGYTDETIGFNYQTAAYENYMHEQSREINFSISDGGAGDQGLMFGYACQETKELMPLPIIVAHSLMRRQEELRKSGRLDWLLPDAKSQVSVRYENSVPVSIDTVVLSTQHKDGITQDLISNEIKEHIINPIVHQYLPGSMPECLINPSGSFTIGGPHGDTGLTGRKIIVDTYGGSCPHGGGAFSGKDPSKVDRSGAYAARYIAKHIVAAGLAERCTVQISFAIGKADPTSLYVNNHNTGKADDEKLQKLIRTLFDLTPNGIIKTLNLKRPIYLATAAYGHFGNLNFPWEVLNEEILNKLKN